MPSHTFSLMTSTVEDSIDASTATVTATVLVPVIVIVPPIAATSEVNEDENL